MVDYNERLVVMGIDPGTSDLGVSILTTAIEPATITVEHAETLKLPNRVPNIVAIEELCSPRMARIQHLGLQLADMLDYYQPHVVICESPFMGRFAQAFEALTELMWVIRTHMWEYDPTISLITVPPVPVKKNLGLSKKHELKDKDLVRDRLYKRKDIEWNIEKDLLDEHSIDATAVGVFCLDLTVLSRETT